MNKKGDVPSAKKGRPKKEDQSEAAKLRQSAIRDRPQFIFELGIKVQSFQSAIILLVASYT